jgi:hypothetical protein
MTETNELQPQPEAGLQAAEVQATPAPEVTETQAVENETQGESAIAESPITEETAADMLDGSAVEESPAIDESATPL